MASTTVTLRPDVIIQDNTGWGGFNWLGGSISKINDDSDATSAQTSAFNDNGDLIVGLTTFTLPPDAVVLWVKTRIRCEAFAGGQATADYHPNGDGYGIQNSGGNKMPTRDILNVSGSVGSLIQNHEGAQHLTNFSGGTWTQADIDGLRFYATCPTYPGSGSAIHIHEAYVDVVYNRPPTATVTGPTGEVDTTNRPNVTWTYADADSDVQTNYHIKIFTDADVQSGSFDPATFPAVWDSGSVASAATSVQVGQSLPANVNMWAYVRVFDGVLWSDWATNTGLSFTGQAEGMASTPDHASLDITGDIDIRVRLSMDDWTPAAGMDFVGKGGFTNENAYIFNTDGVSLRMDWTEDGSTDKELEVTVPATWEAGSTRWIGVTLDVDNGAGQHEAKFYTITGESADPDITAWTQVGSTKTGAGTTSIHSSGIRLAVGARGADSATNASPSGTGLEGVVERVQIRNGINGTLVADPDFTDLSEWGGGDSDTDTGTDSTGKVWTLNDTTILGPTTFFISASGLDKPGRVFFAESSGPGSDGAGFYEFDDTNREGSFRWKSAPFRDPGGRQVEIREVHVYCRSYDANAFIRVTVNGTAKTQTMTVPGRQHLRFLFSERDEVLDVLVESEAGTKASQEAPTIEVVRVGWRPNHMLR